MTLCFYFVLFGVIMLTHKQREVLSFITTYHDTHKITPSFDEIKDAINLKSKSGVHRLIDALVVRGYIIKLARKARAIEIIKPLDPLPFHTPSTCSVPLFGKIAAGLPIEAIQNESWDIPGIDYIEIPSSLLKSNQHYFALEVEGDSMIDAGILEGDLGLFFPQDNPKNGQIVVALINNEEATLKYYYKKDATIELHPANKKYAPQIYSSENVHIQGQLHALWRNYG
jgi:repressor LexA